MEKRYVIIGVLFSVLLHALLLTFVFKQDMLKNFFPKKEVKAMKVTLVTAKNVKKVKPQEDKKKTRTQQSAAPKEAPKPQKKQQNQEKKTTKIASKSEKKVKTNEPKEKPKQEKKPSQKEAKTHRGRPPKLDKTPDKKPIVQEQDLSAEVVEEKADNFLEALDFINQLQAEKAAHLEGEDMEEPQNITVSDQMDIAVVKKHIERNWYKTPGVAKGHTVHIRLNLNRDGTISKIEVVQESGSSAFDRSLLRAVRKSAPLPIPAEKYDLFETIDLHFTDET